MKIPPPDYLLQAVCCAAIFAGFGFVGNPSMWDLLPKVAAGTQPSGEIFLWTAVLAGLAAYGLGTAVARGLASYGVRLTRPSEQADDYDDPPAG